MDPRTLGRKCRFRLDLGFLELGNSHRIMALPSASMPERLPTNEGPPLIGSFWPHRAIRVVAGVFLPMLTLACWDQVPFRTGPHGLGPIGVGHGRALRPQTVVRPGLLESTWIRTRSHRNSLVCPRALRHQPVSVVCGFRISYLAEPSGGLRPV